MRRESRPTDVSSTMRPALRDSLCGIVLASFLAALGGVAFSSGGH
jgi:hypothetical protein